MPELTFTLDHVKRGCESGRQGAAKVMRPDGRYTLRDLVAGGIQPADIAWLLAERAARDGSTVPLLQAWARLACRLQGVRRQRYGTPAECTAAIQAAMKAWATGRPTSKGAKQWAFGLLLDLINTGEF